MIKYKTPKIVLNIILISFLTLIFKDFIYANTNHNQSKYINQIIPHNIGRILDTYSGTDNKLIYCILSLHCDKGSQENIAKIIDKLKIKHKKDLNLVGIEGSYDNVNTKMFNDIKDKQAKEKLMQFFLMRGDIEGTEIYSIENPGQVKLVGLEDKEIYTNNFKSLYRSMEYYEDIDKLCKDAQRIIDIGKKVLYPEELKKIELVELKYKTNKISMSEYIKKITKKNTKLLNSYPNLKKIIELESIRNTLSNNMISSETKIVLKQLTLNVKDKELLSQNKGTSYYTAINEILKEKKVKLGKNYKNLSKYLKYLELDESIKRDDLNEEINNLIYMVKYNYVHRWQDVVDVLNAEEYFKLLKSYLKK